ncbi:hypothetical protein [Desulfovibrio desulfuricans]|uniref:hypothetical protein n=1 Tax=Desulfovibrio desulfuricans TaxID=876 RepID=UPI003983E2F9
MQDKFSLQEVETPAAALPHSVTGTPMWLFDLQDHTLISLVNSIVAARTHNEAMFQPDSGLHPHGIIEMASAPGLRMARAVMILLESLENGGAEERLQALRRLHDEVFYSVHSPLQHNTARVLIQIMKDIVRASPDQFRQLPLAHEFHRAVRGTPRIIRKLLGTYHLLEMPEEWNQHAFDHHVHDASTKGRKNPTHLVMDAWVKGIRFLTVIYYNTVDSDVAQELLRAARIMGITVRIGIEFKASLGGKFVEFIWSPLNTESPKYFAELSHRSDIATVLGEYAVVNDWMRNHLLELLRNWNAIHAPELALQWGFASLPALKEEDFFTYMGQRQPSALHLAEYICQEWLPLVQQQCSAAIKMAVAAESQESVKQLNVVQEFLGGLVPDDVLETWLTPAANPELVFPKQPDSRLPAVMLNPPELLLERLVPLHPCQMVLNLAGLTAQDVLELLWRGRGRITHLELFNLRQWSNGQLAHVSAINSLQRAINEGSIPRLKQVIRQIIDGEESSPERQKLFQQILDNIQPFQELYAISRLGSRIGTDSTSRSHRTHGMGIVFVETLPVQARWRLRREKSAQRLTLPIYTDVYRFVHYHESLQDVPWGLRVLKNITGLRSGWSVRGWGLEKKTTRVRADGNLVTLGGVDAQGVGRDVGRHEPEMAERLEAHDYTCINSNLINIIKVIAGFIPAQWAFWHVGSWWVLTWFGALLWFAITAIRNVGQSVVGGRGVTSSMLITWKRYVSWNRMADSLLYTGISVPLLEVVVRLWILQNLLGLTVQDNELVVYTVIAMVNSAYISGHNIYRGLPKEAIVGNLFRSALSIPLSVVIGKSLLLGFVALGLPDPVMLLQNCAAIVSKCSSDVVAAIIEGFADRNMYLKMRQRDFDGKFAQLYKNITRQELLFPQQSLASMLHDPSAFWLALYNKDRSVANQLMAHLLDIMFMWYYQPRARDVFCKKMRTTPPEERNTIMGLFGLLALEKVVSTLILKGLLGTDFSSALTFYLQKNRDFMADMRSWALKNNIDNIECYSCYDKIYDEC